MPTWSRGLTDVLGMDGEAFMEAFEKALGRPGIQSKLAQCVSAELKADMDKMQSEINDLKDLIIDTRISKLNDLIVEKDRKISVPENRRTHCENDLEVLEQYTHRNFLRAAGVAEPNAAAGEDIEQVVLDIFNNTMGLEANGLAVMPDDLDRIHGLGKPADNKNWQIIVKFATYRVRHRVFSAEKRLNPRQHDWTENRPWFEKATQPPADVPAEPPADAPAQKYYISEDLTRSRSNLLWKSREAKWQVGLLTGCWSHDGQILVKTRQGLIIPINTELQQNEVMAYGAKTLPQNRPNKGR